MSEKAPLPKGLEHKHGDIDASVESKNNLERAQKAADEAEKESLNSQVESLQSAAENQAISGKEVNVGDTAAESGAQTFGVDKKLKSDAYTRSLRKIRTDLNVPNRVLSRVVHNRVIESVSNTSAKTVARPSAFLGGSFAALIGSVILLYMSKQYGFTYNYSAFFVLFAAGFFLALILELISKLLFRRRHTIDQ